MKKLRNWVKTRAKILAIAIIAISIASLLLLVHLGSLTHGVSQRELDTAQQYSSLSVMAHNPVNLPYTVVGWLLSQLSLHNVSWLRVPSVVFAGLAIFATLYVLRRWYGPRTAFFGFVVFASSAWTLHVGRLATTDVMLMWGLAMLLFGNVFLHEHTDRKAAGFIWILVQTVLLYVPGMVWFVLLNAFWQRRDIREAISTSKTWPSRVGLVILSAVMLTPLIVGSIIGSAKSTGLTVLGLPSAAPSAIDVAHNVVDAVLFIAVRGKAADDVWLNHLPIFGAFLTVMFLAGCLFYAKHWHASRTKLILSFLLLGLVLSSLGGSVTVGIIVPLLYLVAAAGIAYILHLWLTVFPRNPIARGVGIGIMAVAIAVSATYGLRQYFVAWPHHPQTNAVFKKYKT